MNLPRKRLKPQIEALAPPTPPFHLEARQQSPALWYVVLDANGYPQARGAQEMCERVLEGLQRQYPVTGASVPRKRLPKAPEAPVAPRRRLRSM